MFSKMAGRPERLTKKKKKADQALEAGWPDADGHDVCESQRHGHIHEDKPLRQRQD
jgi:hypothetical protein